jgi:hypothetical protein
VTQDLGELLPLLIEVGETSVRSNMSGTVELDYAELARQHRGGRDRR